MFVYLSGVLAGSLWTSILIPGVFLSGASSGVYALVTAHLATVIMNYR
jgi:rhomboid-related protein 1/2/3